MIILNCERVNEMVHVCEDREHKMCFCFGVNERYLSCCYKKEVSPIAKDGAKATYNGKKGVGV